MIDWVWLADPCISIHDRLGVGHHGTGRWSSRQAIFDYGRISILMDDPGQQAKFDNDWT